MKTKKQIIQRKGTFSTDILLDRIGYEQMTPRQRELLERDLRDIDQAGEDLRSQFENSRVELSYEYKNLPLELKKHFHDLAAKIGNMIYDFTDAATELLEAMDEQDEQENMVEHYGRIRQTWRVKTTKGREFRATTGSTVEYSAKSAACVRLIVHQLRERRVLRKGESIKSIRKAK